MQFDLSLPQDKLYFSEYTDDFVAINGQKYSVSIRINNTQVTELNEFDFSCFNEAIFQEALDEANKPEVIIIGCGVTQKFIDPKIIAKLASNGIGIEVMRTPSAIKTFNLLRSDDRSVWAWILPNKA